MRKERDFSRCKRSGPERSTRTHDIVIEQGGSHKYAMVAREPSLKRKFSAVARLAGGSAGLSRQNILDARVRTLAIKRGDFLSPEDTS